MGKDKRGFLQSLLDDIEDEDVKYGPKGRPRKQLSEREARKKAEREAYASLEEGED